MTGLSTSLKCRVFETYSGHGAVVEEPDTLCHEAADRVYTLEGLLVWIRQHQSFHTLPHDIQVRVEMELPRNEASAKRFADVEATW